MNTEKKFGFATRQIHAGHMENAAGSLCAPIYQTSTFAFSTVQQGGARFAGEEGGYIYTRLGNPTLGAVEEKLASLEGGEAAMAAASGMGAISSALWTSVVAGDEIVADETLYGCTYALLNHGMTKFGVKVTLTDLSDIENLKKNLTDKELAGRIVEVNDRLLACRFRFQDDSRTVQFTLFSGFETDWKTAKLLVEVNPRFSFLLNDLTSQFTRFELAEFTALRSSYAKECYRRLKQYRQTGVWKVSLEDFRRLLDVPKSYRPSEINKYVLKPIEEELGPLLNLKVHRKYLKKKPGRGRASLVGFEFEFDPEKVPGGAPAPRVELSGSVVTDEARKSLRDVSKTPVPDLSVPGEGPALDPDTQAFLDAHGGHGFAGAEGYVSDWPSAA